MPSKPCEDNKLSEEQTMKTKPLLDKCFNMFGEPLPKEIRKRIKLFLLYPSPDTWDDVHGILINGHTTIWQAVLKAYPGFTKVGRTFDDKWNMVKEWSEIPTPTMVMKAIRENFKSNKNR